MHATSYSIRFTPLVFYFFCLYAVPTGEVPLAVSFTENMFQVYRVARPRSVVFHY